MGEFCSASLRSFETWIPVEVRMLVDDDLICEDIDLADRDDLGVCQADRAPSILRTANKLIQELARVEHVDASVGCLLGPP